MALVALLSNPRSTGNQSLLPRVRRYCAAHEDIFHYEVESADQIGAALKTIARVKPKVLVINGGDGTVQATLTELYRGGHFGSSPPPVAVMPNGKTNMIAHDLGAEGDPIAALEHVLRLARTDMSPNIVQRELISLSDGNPERQPVLGMFLGGAGLADAMLYCRHRLYPYLPTGIAHFLALLVGVLSIMFGRWARFLPLRPKLLRVSVVRRGVIQGAFAFLMVTTLQRLLFSGSMPAAGQRVGAMQLLVIERSVPALMRALFASIGGRLGRYRLRGVHLERGDEIRIEGDQSSLILDGELFEAKCGRPIVLRPTPPVPFLRLAA